MRQIDVVTSNRNYPIVFLPLITQSADIPNFSLSEYTSSNQIFVVTNKKVADLYLSGLLAHLDNYDIHVYLMEDGEQYKNFITYQSIISELLQSRHKRNATVVALGGGVVGDMAGFVAATYQRGVNFIQVPTTLLAMVDSAVGGKTAINHPEGKNMVGAFYQPTTVCIDIACLNSLPPREFKAGLAEVLKYALLSEDESLLNFLEQEHSKIVSFDQAVLEQLIAECCLIKAKIVESDEKEQGVRAHLNLGHTFAHALEKLGEYSLYLHGEAVAIGIMMAFDLALELNYISFDYHQRVERLFSRFEIETKTEKYFSADEVVKVMRLDKKNQSDVIRLILPVDTARVSIVDFSERSMLMSVIGKRIGL